MIERWKEVLQQKDNERSLLASHLLIDSGSLQTGGEYTFSYGLKSPMKIDTDRLMGNHELYQEVCVLLAEAVRLNPTFAIKKPEVVAGVITGGAALAQGVARILGTRFAARLGSTDTPEKREWVSGYIARGDQVVVIEDIVTTSGNAVECCKRIETEGGMPILVVSLFSYDFGVAARNFKIKGIPFYSLANFNSLTHLLNPDLVTRLREWHTGASKLYSQSG